MDVLEEEKRRRLEQLPEDGLDDAVQTGAPEGRLEVVRFLGGAHRCIDDVRHEWRPRHELAVDPLEPLGERERVRLRVAVDRDVE